MSASGISTDEVRDFWQQASCGEAYAVGDTLGEQFEAHRRARFELEPMIAGFARFEEGQGRDVLEVGVGMGADHVEWARNGPRFLAGVDLTPRAVAWTARRLRHYGCTSALHVADAERLPFADGTFDIVYSWGVLHHSPNTGAALAEVNRVLRPGGQALIMIYHARSIVGYLLWLRYALLAGKPRRTLSDIYSEHLESPGTTAYTEPQAQALFADFRDVNIRTELGIGDLLQGEVGQRHKSRVLGMAKTLWPRRLIRALLPGHGLLMMVTANK